MLGMMLMCPLFFAFFVFAGGIGNYWAWGIGIATFVGLHIWLMRRRHGADDGEMHADDAAERNAAPPSRGMPVKEKQHAHAGCCH